MENRCPGKFAQRVRQEMERQSKSIRDVAVGVRTTYEHARRVLSGFAFPSNHMSDDIADFLHIDREELQQLTLEDKLVTKYGKVANVLSGKNPEMEPLERVWPYLSQSHKDDLVRIATLFAEGDRATVKAPHRRGHRGRAS